MCIRDRRTLNHNIPSGQAVRLVKAADEFGEGIFVAKEIGRMTGGVDMLEAQSMHHEKEALPFSDIAVLCRTHRQLELIEKCLRHDDIPCVISGREDYLNSDDVRGALSFFHSLEDISDIASVGTSLRLLWGCPADLIEKAQKICAGIKAFDAELIREALCCNMPAAIGNAGAPAYNMSGAELESTNEGIPNTDTALQTAQTQNTQKVLHDGADKDAEREYIPDSSIHNVKAVSYTHLVGEKPHPDYDMADWVLGKFQGEDKKAIDQAVKRAADAVECILAEGIDRGMSRFNG